MTCKVQKLNNYPCIHCADDTDENLLTDFWINSDGTKSFCCRSCHDRYEQPECFKKITQSQKKKLVSDVKLLERIEWAKEPFPNGITTKITPTSEHNISKLRNIAKQKEKDWGNKMIGQVSNGNWTTLLGEKLVYDVLKILGENPRKPIKKNGYQPDWETDNYIIEVKTRSWTSSGTAGEKVPAVMYKYSDIPELYKKPLKIICVAYQEYEFTNGNTKLFGDVGKKKRAMLDMAYSWGIEYIKFSELI